MRRKNFAVLSCLLLGAVMAVTTACGGGNSALNPNFQPQISNQTDNFQFQTTGVSNVTQTLTYTWQNTGTASSVNQACAITAGTAFVTLKDASGIAVYSGDLKGNGTFTSIQGASGNWTIIVTLTKVNGTLNFRAQKM